MKFASLALYALLAGAAASQKLVPQQLPASKDTLVGSSMPTKKEESVAGNNIVPIDDIFTCTCRSDYHCQQTKYCGSTCVFDKYDKLTGKCQNVDTPTTPAPTSPPPTPSPTPPPTPEPTFPHFPPTKGGDCGKCQTDYDCQRNPYCPSKCVFSRYSGVGQCQDDIGIEPTQSPIRKIDPQQCCDNPRNIPTECEVRLLISIMEEAVGINFAMLPQWIRASFHDAGTFDQNVPEGGANGCLMNHPPMRNMPENHNLDLALNTVAVVKSLWEGHPDTCLNVSAADMIQFAGWFSVLRQKDTPGLTNSKRQEIIKLTRWGRPDEENCDTAWTSNLPGFSLGTEGSNIPLRCQVAGGEIKDKMMDRNGFTDIEAVALLGAHTIGLMRNVFGTGGPFVSKWDHNGDDDATPQGGVFDNGYHHYLANDVVEKNAHDFANNVAAFDMVFHTWFRETDTGIGQLDTDMAIAFESQDTNVHPHFHKFTHMFADDNNVFMKHFLDAYQKMSALGVTVKLVNALSCEAGCTGTIKAPIKPTLSIQEKQQIDAAVVDALLEAKDTIKDTQKTLAADILIATTPVELLADF